MSQLQTERLLNDLDNIRHQVGVGADSEATQPPAAASESSTIMTAFNTAVERAMEQHRTPDVEQIAADMAMTSSQLRRRVRAITGLTPLAYANSLRMARARRLLNSRPDMSIGDVADRCGFYDVAYFSKLFKQVYQVAPSKYREINT